MKRLFIDANVFLRFFVPDHAVRQEECGRLMAAVERGDVSAVTAGLVIAEVEWTARSFYKIPKGEIIDFLATLVTMPSLTIINEINWPQALALYRTAGVKFIDAAIAAGLGSIFNADTVVSYDRDFDKLGVKRLEPKQVLAI